MSKRKFGITLVIFGTLVLIGAVFAFGYQEFGEAFVPGYNGTESYYWGLTIAPLRDYALPLILIGVPLFTVGFAIMVRGRVFH